MTIDVKGERTDSLSERVAEEIRVILARRRMRQSQLARLVGANEQWVSVRLRGIQPIDLNDLERFAHALQVSVFELLPRPAVVANPSTGHTDIDGAARRVAIQEKPGADPRSARPNYPDRVRPADRRPGWHQQFPVLPPKVIPSAPVFNRPVRRPRAALANR